MMQQNAEQVFAACYTGHYPSCTTAQVDYGAVPLMSSPIDINRNSPEEEYAASSSLSSDYTRPTQLSYEKRRIIHGRQYIDTSEPLVEEAPMAAKEVDDKQMVSFVVADLHDKIRSSTSSPPCSDSVGKTSTATSSGSPTPYPPLLPDPNVLLDLEANARNISNSLDQMLREFRGSLHGMTDLTVECMECYTSAIGKTCDNVDGAVKSTYQLLAKAEELCLVMKPVPKLAQQIKEIKRVLDLFESHLQKSIG